MPTQCAMRIAYSAEYIYQSMISVIYVSNGRMLPWFYISHLMYAG
jgi:hypothetical protein